MKRVWSFPSNRSMHARSFETKVSQDDAGGGEHIAYKPISYQSVFCSVLSTCVSATGLLCVILKSLTFFNTNDGVSGT